MVLLDTNKFKTTYCFSMKEWLREFLTDLMPWPIDPTPLLRGCDGFRHTRGPRGRFS